MYIGNILVEVMGVKLVPLENQFTRRNIRTSNLVLGAKNKHLSKIDLKHITQLGKLVFSDGKINKKKIFITGIV